MRRKLVWFAVLMAAVTALALTTCRRFPNPTKPIVPSSSLAAPFNLSVLVTDAFMDAAYEASIGLAREKGAFPDFQAEAYLDRPFIRALPGAIQAAIRASGIRNSHLTAIAPAGTISLLANNVSSGIEPSFGFEALRRVT